MSINDLINLRQQQDEKTETVTVRLSPYYLGILDDLAASLDVTRQRLLTEIIKEGVEGTLSAYDEREKELLHAQIQAMESNPHETEEDEDTDGKSGPRFFILNTNKRHDLDTHLDMVTNGIAAAFCNPWKYQIDRIKEGSVVFLYENGVGIVGSGIAPGVVEQVEYKGTPENEYRQKLKNYKRINPLNAREIKKITGRNWRFLKVLFSIPASSGAKIQNHMEPV